MMCDPRYWKSEKCFMVFPAKVVMVMVGSGDDKVCSVLLVYSKDQRGRLLLRVRGVAIRH